MHAPLAMSTDLHKKKSSRLSKKKRKKKKECWPDVGPNSASELSRMFNSKRRGPASSTDIDRPN